LLLAACGDSGEPPEPPPEPRTCHLPRDDRRIVEIEAFPWDEWFALRADGTLVQFSSYGFQEWEEAAAGEEPCITSIDADGTLAGTSYRGSVTMIDYILGNYRGLEFPHTFDLFGSREVVAVLGTWDLALLDDESTAWIYWPDRAPDDSTGHQRLEAVALPGPVVQISGDAGTCFLLESGDVYCVDMAPNAEPKYGLGDSPPPSGVFQIPVAGVEFLAVGTSHLCVITQARELLCAGRGGSGELGVPKDELAPTFKRSSFEPARDVPEFERVWLRYGSTCGATDDGELWCWGRRIELPSPTEPVMPPTLVGTFPGLLDVALSDYSTCVLRADHRVVCRGALPEYLACSQEDGWDVMGIDDCPPPGGGF
jgi:hypothetical protein